MSEHAQVDDCQVFCWLVYIRDTLKRNSEAEKITQMCDFNFPEYFMFGNTSITTAYLFASATNSFGFWNDLKEDDIDNCAGRNTCNSVLSLK